MAPWSDDTYYDGESECEAGEGSGGQAQQGAGDKEDSDEASVVELRVALCCDECEERIMDHLMNLSGVQGVLCDQNQQKVTVSGTASSEDILNACKELFPDSELWD